MVTRFTIWGAANYALSTHKSVSRARVELAPSDRKSDVLTARPTGHTLAAMDYLPTVLPSMLRVHSSLWLA